jgi:ABC-type amino acid transport substrate-binding protein
VRTLLAAFVILPLCLAAAPAFAAGAETGALRVGLYAAEPFVMETGPGSYSGLAFNVWEMAAARLDVQSEYVLYHSIKQLLDDARSGKIDCIVGNVAVTHERAADLTFGFPWYDDGLRILVKQSQERNLSVWSVLRQRGHTGVYMWIALLFAAMTFGHFLLRRHKDADFPACRLEGASLSLYEVVRVAKSGVMSKNYLGWAGYILLTVWMLFGFGLLAYVTSTFTSALVVAAGQRGEDIHSLNDLSGKRVAVLSHSTGEKYMRKTGVRLLPCKTTEEAVGALMKDDADAVVMDAAELEYWVHSHPKKNVQVVGNTFKPCKYAFAANKQHVRLMDLVSEEVIRLLDDGIVEGLKDNYFGRVRY